MVLRASEQQNTVETILDTRRVKPEQVLALRRVVWPDDEISRSEAELLFEINDTLEETCGEWRDFFAEAMVAHLLNQQTPRGYLRDIDASWFQERILADGAVKGETELETLVQLLEKAMDVPDRLAQFALEAVRNAVLTGDGELVGNGRLRKGEIGDAEVALLRRVLYAKAGGRSAAICREEAELLCDLNDATADSKNCTAWAALFVNALSNYLLVQNGYEPPSRERMKEIDLWMNSPTSGVRGFLSRITGEARDSDSLLGTLKSAFTGETPMEHYYAVRNLADAALQAEAQMVDTQEARWLIQRFGRDGRITPNERALLSMLRAGDFEIDPVLAPMLKG